MSRSCPSCGHENRDGSRFCEDCGARLATRCAACGTELRPAAKFCDGCGAPVADAARTAAREHPPRDYTPKHLAEKILHGKSALEGERKQVTVLFADVKGSMDLAEQVDPEEWHRILNRFFEILTDGVHRFEGTVNQYTGDGIMALFGAPIAHEDHAQRACYATLYLTDELRQYARDLKRERGLSFSTRMGLNSGEVVVGKIGDDLRMDYTAQGHTVGLAARMEQLAEPGKVYLTEHTAALVSGYFELEDLGQFELPGARASVGVRELQGVGQLRTRLDLARTRGFTRFVGRAHEIHTLETALAQALEGKGQVVGVVGEAGVGKSRLCLEFIEGCRAKGIPVHEAHCPAHGRSVPFLPVLELFRSFFAINEQDDPAEARRKIAGTLVLLDEAFQETLPLVFEFLGVSDPERPLARIDPEARQRQLFALVRRLFEARSKREPTVTLLDDLHWIDAGSDAFVAQAVEAVSGTRTLLLTNFRPEYDAPWMNRSHYQQVPLLPLGPEAVAELLDDLIGSDPSLTPLREQIQSRTGGNPFFVEEMVQSLVEAGSLEGSRGAYRLVEPIERVALPSTVQTVLAARIDRLAEREKRVLQLASVIGKEIPEPLLRRIAELPDLDLRSALSELTRAEFLFEKALYPEAEYAFRHPLTHEVAYGSQLAERRKPLHAAVARALEQLQPEKLDENAALLAHHLEQADEKLPAARWHARAAEWVGVQNLSEASEHWHKVRSLTAAIVNSRESDELGARACGQLLNFGWRTGLGEEEASALLAEGRALAEKAEEPELVGILLTTFGAVKYGRGAIRESIEIFKETIALAEALGDRKLVAVFTTTLIDTNFLLGKLSDAMRLCDQVADALRDDPGYRTDIFGLATYEWALGRRAAWMLMAMGRIDEGFSELARVLQLARQRGETEIVGWIHSNYGRLADWADDPSAALRHAQQGLEIADKQGSLLSIAFSYGALGIAHHAAGDAEEAVRLLTRRVAISRDRGLLRSWEPFHLAHLSSAYRSARHLDRAIETALEATESARRMGTRIWECEGQLSLARALLDFDGVAERKRIESALSRVGTLIEETGARSFLPLLHEARAQLAALDRDEATRERELSEARRLFTEMGATRHANRLAKELER